MSTEVETIPTADRQAHLQIGCVQEAHARRTGVPIAAALVGALAALVASGCSSKNPDALTGMNVDENLAIMNATANFEGNSVARTISGADAKHEADKPSDRSGNATAIKANARSEATAQQRSEEVSASGATANNRTEEDESGADATNQNDAPNGA
jgi:hypothetical protein